MASVVEYIHGVLAPKPLSPLFQPGGLLDYWFCNEDVTLTLGFIFLLFLIDKLFVGPFLSPKSRYFALHVVANTISAIASFPDVKRALLDSPMDCFSGPATSIVANCAAASIHLYHIIGFKLRWDDIFHHLTFVSVLCGLAIPYKQIGGAANNMGCFFLCGVPGGIDYLNLVLKEEGWMSKKTQKMWCTRINVWLRGPSMSVYAFLAFHTWYSNDCQFPLIILFIVGALHFYNGQYYAQQAVESWAVFLHKEAGVGLDSGPSSPAAVGGGIKADGKGKKRGASPKTD